MGMNVNKILNVAVTAALIGGITIGCSKRETPIDPKDVEIQKLKEEQKKLQEEMQVLTEQRNKAYCEGDMAKLEAAEAKLNECEADGIELDETLAFYTNFEVDSATADTDSESTEAGDEDSETLPEPEAAPQPVDGPAANEDQATPPKTPSVFGEDIDCSKYAKAEDSETEQVEAAE